MIIAFVYRFGSPSPTYGVSGSPHAFFFFRGAFFQNMCFVLPNTERCVNICLITDNIFNLRYCVATVRQHFLSKIMGDLHLKCYRRRQCWRGFQRSHHSAPKDRWVRMQYRKHAPQSNQQVYIHQIYIYHICITNIYIAKIHMYIFILMLYVSENNVYIYIYMYIYIYNAIYCYFVLTNIVF